MLTAVLSIPAILMAMACGVVATPAPISDTLSTVTARNTLQVTPSVTSTITPKDCREDKILEDYLYRHLNLIWNLHPFLWYLQDLDHALEMDRHLVNDREWNYEVKVTVSNLFDSADFIESRLAPSHFRPHGNDMILVATALRETVTLYVDSLKNGDHEMRRKAIEFAEHIDNFLSSTTKDLNQYCTNHSFLN